MIADSGVKIHLTKMASNNTSILCHYCYYHTMEIIHDKLYQPEDYLGIS